MCYGSRDSQKSIFEFYNNMFSPPNALLLTLFGVIMLTQDENILFLFFFKYGDDEFFDSRTFNHEIVYFHAMCVCLLICTRCTKMEI